MDRNRDFRIFVTIYEISLGLGQCRWYIIYIFIGKNRELPVKKNENHSAKS